MQVNASSALYNAAKQVGTAHRGSPASSFQRQISLLLVRFVLVSRAASPHHSLPRQMVDLRKRSSDTFFTIKRNFFFLPH